MNRTTPTPAKPKHEYHIRWMIRRDLEDVVRIERACFAQFPWDEDYFTRTLRTRNRIGMTAEASFAGSLKIVGYMVYEMHRDRLVVLNFATDPRFQRSGVGTAMVDKLKAKLSTNPGRRTCIALEVRESNLDGLNFFKSQGFRAVKLLRDFYEECDEDAILMRYRNTP